MVLPPSDKPAASAAPRGNAWLPSSARTETWQTRFARNTTGPINNIGRTANASATAVSPNGPNTRVAMMMGSSLARICSRCS